VFCTLLISCCCVLVRICVDVCVCVCVYVCVCVCVYVCVCVCTCVCLSLLMVFLFLAFSISLRVELPKLFELGEVQHLPGYSSAADRVTVSALLGLLDAGDWDNAVAVWSSFLAVSPVFVVIVCVLSLVPRAAVILSGFLKTTFFQGRGRSSGRIRDGGFAVHSSLIPSHVVHPRACSPPCCVCV
jgi:hypothetical protein